MNEAASTARRATERLDPDGRGLARAAALLAGGGLVAFPTETVYGLGADARNGRAVAALYAAKGRPRFNPLIAHVADIGSARRQGMFDELASRLAEAFWPGPLTLVVPAPAEMEVCDLARAGLASVALRVPGHEIASDLLRGCAFPVVAPSANRSGRVSPTRADHVIADLDGRIDAVLDGGPTLIGIESTIVACLGGSPVLLRPGGIAREAIEDVLHARLGSGRQAPSAPLAPGALLSHYAPRASVRLNATTFRAGEAALLFGPMDARGAEPVLNLSPSANLTQAAANLFGYLRRLDEKGPTAIAVAEIPEVGLGDAINDRLRRAAAPR